MNEAVEIFREEALEHLDTLESALLEIEEHPDDEQINLAFRAMHTIKGAAGMVGFDHLSHFTHHLESFFDRARNGEFLLSAPMISLILECRDHIQQLLDTNPPDTGQISVSDVLVARLHAFVPLKDESIAPSEVLSESPEVSFDGEDLKWWRIEITPALLAFQDGFDLKPLLRELKSMGTMASFIRMGEFETDAFDPQNCYLNVLVLLQSSASYSDLEDVFIFVADDWQVVIEPLGVDSNLEELTSVVSEHGWLSIQELQSHLGQSPGQSSSAIAVKESSSASIHDDSPSSSPSIAEKAAPSKTSSAGSKKISSEQVVKVPSGKLDILMNLIGELVIVQARLNEVSRSQHNEQLDSLVEELSLLGTELRDTAFDIRMLPIGSTFARFRRLVRDLGRELNKNVQLKTEGAETELDKMVLDRLGDPLIHLLRNSMDHGIEHPDERIAAGKPEKGTILLSAAHQDGQIVVTIADDGAGLDCEKILNKARQSGLVAANQELSPRKIFSLIFEPGFSTAEQVSDVSGRGVGMDVVRASIEAMQGRVEIDSRAGKGTTITIYLPMTLAIIEGLMVKVANERYIIPLSVVEECIETSAAEESRKDGARLVKNRDELIPCVRLRELFSVYGKSPDIEQTVITFTGKERIGVTVDEVIGQYQTVIKSLSRLYQHIPGLMGATILGNGDVAMILDINKLIDEAQPVMELMLDMSK
ncbi:MAG: Chemotaxis protein CheA [Candidatus Celerinatantimonas neptuna]|nr:MAG: Chemotaxis protein CheA [Candidatus Celerinatantimonas neptuna]